MRYANHQRLGSIDAWEKHILAAARGASRDVGGPVPANLTELLEIVELAIESHPTMAKPMSGARDEILELLRLKARRRELLKMPIPHRMLHLVHDEEPMPIDEIVKRCVSGDYGKISAKQARAAFENLLARGLIEAYQDEAGGDRARGTVH